MKKLLTLFLVLGIAALSIGSAEAIVSTDPMKISVGARALGMGKASVAVAEDADTVFTNPAGLGKIMKPKVATMYTNLLGDVNYIVLGGAYPFGAKSAIGAGVVTANVGGIGLFNTTGSSVGEADWNNSVVFVSYGTRIMDDKLKVGGSVKYYSNGGKGSTDVDSASGTAFGLDAGALYSVNDSLDLGVKLDNILATKMQAENGVGQDLPSAIKVGAAYNLPILSRKLTLAADYALNSGAENTMHLGAEYKVTPILALRGGLDQSSAPGGAETNFTAGLGLRVAGVAFDFAYHPYGGLSEDTTYYFSLGYVGPPEPTELDLEMAVKTPADKSIIYSDHVKVSGTLKGNYKDITVTVNEVNASLANDGKFTASVPVNAVGKKLIHVEAADKKGRKLTADRRILRLVSFKDVNKGYWAKKPIEHTGTVGLVQGYPDKTFKPDRNLTRAELTALLVRAKGYKVPGHPVKVFKDVSSKHWAAGYIEIARRTGLVKGYLDGRFRPNNRIINSEAITVLARFDGLSKKYGKTAFKDVAKNHWSAGFVNAAEEAGMLSYITDDKLKPNTPVTRAQSVKMLSTTSMASKLIDDLLTWDKGFQFEITRPTIKASVN